MDLTDKECGQMVKELLSFIKTVLPLMLSFDKNYITEYNLGLMPYLNLLLIAPCIYAYWASQT